MAQSVSFQFHNGTIKTDYSFILPAILPKFQFHNGTIKTSLVLGIIAQFNSNFNSIVVQLKHTSEVNKQE